MRLFPAFAVKGVERLSGRLPARYRAPFKAFVAVCAALLLAFELWRLWAGLEVAAPIWQQQFERMSAFGNLSATAAIAAYSVTAIVFFGSMALVAFALRALHRKLSR